MTASALSQDPESLLPAGSRRACPCRSLDWLVLLALCALGAAVVWLALCAPWSSLTLATPEPYIAEGEGAQMLPKSSLIKNRTMDWFYGPGTDGVVFSNNFSYDTASKKLEVKVRGLYFIYAQLAVRCIVSKCNKAEAINLYIYQQSENTKDTVVLTVSLHLSSKPEERMSKFSAALHPLKEGDSLYVVLKVEGGKVDDDEWQLDQDNRKDNFFGLFRL